MKSETTGLLTIHLSPLLSFALTSLRLRNFGTSCRRFQVNLSILCGLCLLFGSVSLCHAEIHKYQDASGRDHFVDSPEKIPEQYRHQSTSTLKEISRGGKAQFTTPPPRSSREGNQQSRVKVYVTHWCGICRALERFLHQKQIKFTQHDIESDPAAMREFRAAGARGVPMIKIGSKVIFGFNQEMLLQELAGR